MVTSLSPGETRPFASRYPVARSIISSEFRSASTGNGTTPQSSARRRRVVSFGEKATIGTTGRALDAYRAVRPLSVNAMISFAPMSVAMSQAARAVASGTLARCPGCSLER